MRSARHLPPPHHKKPERTIHTSNLRQDINGRSFLILERCPRHAQHTRCILHLQFHLDLARWCAPVCVVVVGMADRIFSAGEITGNVSQVDRVWTFLPPIYAAFFAFYPLMSFAPDFIKAQGVNPRNVLMFVLQVIWMTRQARLGRSLNVSR
jgi:hypothetical protein